jgi:hypothetical protein
LEELSAVEKAPRAGDFFFNTRSQTSSNLIFENMVLNSQTSFLVAYYCSYYELLTVEIGVALEVVLMIKLKNNAHSMVSWRSLRGSTPLGQ